MSRRYPTKHEKMPPPKLTVGEKIVGWMRALAHAFGVLAQVIGFVLALLILWPRMTVSMNTPGIGNYPANEQFTFTNSAILPLHDVTIRMAICEITPVGGQFHDMRVCDYNNEEMGGVIYDHWMTRSLAMDESITVSPGELAGDKLSGLNIAFQIHYKIWCLPFGDWCLPTESTKIFPFMTRLSKDGERYWFAISNTLPILNQ